MSTDARAAWATRLASRFASRFPDVTDRWRTIGREGEHPIVHPDGSMADIAVLWPHLAAHGDMEVLREGELVVGLDKPGMAFSAEVGRGTMEIIVGPCHDLHGIRADYETAMARLLAATEAEGLLVLGYGIQPSTVATADHMAPKRRYHILHEIIGDPWLWFALTASDQVHAAIVRAEIGPVTDVTNLYSAMMIGLCGNSPVFGGAVSGVCSAREARMGGIHAEGHRHGMTEGPCGEPLQWIDRTLGLQFVLDKSGSVPKGYDGTFLAWLEERDLSEEDAFDAWLVHEHYIWNSSRPRSAHGTVELRSPCQQPWSEHMTAAALGVAMVEGHQALATLAAEAFGGDAWPVMRAWHGAAIREGLAAAEPRPGFLLEALEICRQALVDRDLDEAVYLDPLFARARAGQNPAQDAIAAFEAGGLAGLIDHTAIRP